MTRAEFFARYDDEMAKRKQKREKALAKARAEARVNALDRHNKYITERKRKDAYR